MLLHFVKVLAHHGSLLLHRLALLIVKASLLSILLVHGLHLTRQLLLPLKQVRVALHQLPHFVVAVPQVISQLANEFTVFAAILAQLLRDLA